MALTIQNQGFWVKVTKPVSYMVKGLRPKEFQDEQHNLSTKRASLPAAGRLTLTS